MVKIFITNDNYSFTICDPWIMSAWCSKKKCNVNQIEYRILRTRCHWDAVKHSLNVNWRPNRSPIYYENGNRLVETKIFTVSVYQSKANLFLFFLIRKGHWDELQFDKIIRKHAGPDVIKFLENSRSCDKITKTPCYRFVVKNWALHFSHFTSLRNTKGCFRNIL